MLMVVMKMVVHFLCRWLGVVVIRWLRGTEISERQAPSTLSLRCPSSQYCSNLPTCLISPTLLVEDCSSDGL